jgi:protein-S-isoprenylcysteine O-methyltransferase Ste14
LTALIAYAELSVTAAGTRLRLKLFGPAASMSSYTGYIFAAAAAALIVLNLLLLTTVFSSSFKLWPTPSPQSWQYYTFWPLFRGGLGLTLFYAIVTARWSEAAEGLRFAIGMICVVIGFGITIYGYFDLGIENTYGADEGLVTNGLYRFSRNPQYVASILGFFGTALAHGGIHAAILCGLAILVYVILPYTEEPWLERAYGDVYITYKRQTPRFL